MKITDITAGTPITISTPIDNMPVTLKTKAISVMDDALLVAPLKYHGVPIPTATQATASVVMPGGRTHQFHLESVLPYENWSDTYYLLRGNEVITNDENQRKAERYIINVLGKAIINHNTTVSAIVYDISIRGLSLLLGKAATANPGDMVRLTFKPEGYSKPFELTLYVVRNFKIGTYDAVGCKMRGIESTLVSYIMNIKKQKEEQKKAASQSRIIIHDESKDTAE